MKIEIETDLSLAKRLTDYCPRPWLFVYEDDNEHCVVASYGPTDSVETDHAQVLAACIRAIAERFHINDMNMLGTIALALDQLKLDSQHRFTNHITETKQ